MVSWKDRIETRVVILAFLLPLAGILSLSLVMLRLLPAEIAGPLVRRAAAWSVAGAAALGGLFWWLVRRWVVLPVLEMRRAAVSLASGDLALELPPGRHDEIGALRADLRTAAGALGAVVSRIRGVAERVTRAATQTERESAEVVQATTVETDAFAHIAASMEELNASIGQISGELERLTDAAATVHASSRETASSTASVLERSQELTASIAEVASTAGEMSHTIRELNWGSTHVSEVSTQTLAAVQQMELFIRSVESRAREAAEGSEQVRREAEELGLDSVRRTIQGMERVRDAVERTSGFVSSLGRRSREIGEIVDVIEGVNDRTGLLALNAAILAAQAGEHGAAFNVVAVEVRKLADRTAQATVQIAELVRNVQAEVAGAVDAMGDGLGKVDAGFSCARASGTALEKIVESSRTSSGKAVSIQESTREQGRGLATVREAMARLEQMAQFLALGTAEQQREAAGIHRSVERIADAADRIRAANEEQTAAGRHSATAAEAVSDGVRRMAQALREAKEGCAQIMQALVQVVDLPRRNRGLALRINQGLRDIHGDTELLQAEVGGFRLPRGQQAGTLRLGVVPLESPAEMHRRFTPLAAHLARVLGRPVELKVALDFDEAVRDLGEGLTQLAWLTPSTYVRARARHGARLLVTALRNGEPHQHAAVVARRDAGIAALADLRGRSFAFGDPDSTSSHIVPRAMLLDAGVALDQLADHAYLGHHDAVAQAVLNREYDAGAVMLSVAKRFEPQGLVVVALSPPIPEFNVCAAPQLGEAEAEAARGALLALDRASAAGAAILDGISPDYTGFVKGRDEAYAGVLRTMERLGLMEGPT